MAEKEKKEKEIEEQVSEQEVTEEEKVDPVEALQKENDELKLALAKMKNDYLKAYADNDNLRKRLLAEAETANKYRAQSFVINILPAIDSLERALAGKDVNDPFVKGIKLTYDSLLNALKNEGVSEIDCLNKPFDANYCHALLTEKVEGVEENIVVEVLQKGYMLKDRLLRAALVKVSE